MALEEFETIYVEARAEWAMNSNSTSAPLRRFLVQVFAPDYYHLKFHATDFHSNTFHAVKSVTQLEDLRNSIGIGGSWFEFVDYITASIKSEGVKLILEKPWDSDDSEHAKLVAQKRKGMPLISIFLSKLMGSAANDAMENLSFGLFKSLKCMQSLVPLEKGHSLHLTNQLSLEKQGSECIHNELEKRQTLVMTKFPDTTGASASFTSNASPDSPGKGSAPNPTPKKVTNRVVPAHRRAKVRGALLQDTEDV